MLNALLRPSKSLVEVGEEEGRSLAVSGRSGGYKTGNDRAHLGLLLGQLRSERRAHA